jgi:hypothetical protein
MKENSDYFDLSNYPKDHFLYDKTNNKVLGKFKHDIVDSKKNVLQITEFIGLRPKCYSYLTNIEGDNKKRCKGVKSYVVNNEIKHTHYKNVLENHTKMIIKQNGFKTDHHNIYSQTITKIALSGEDDKVFIMNDGINTLTHGHYKIKELQK